MKDDTGLVSKKTQSLCKRRQRPSVKVDTDVVRKRHRISAKEDLGVVRKKDRGLK